MGKVLTDLIAAGLVTKLDGHDERLEKMSRAANALAKELKKNRQFLIPAILTGLNANATTSDAMILKAEQALLVEWPTMSTVHTDQPISLYRTLLLEACQQAGEGANAAIIWYTAADTLIYSLLDREASAVREMLHDMARSSEEVATAGVVIERGTKTEAVAPSSKQKKEQVEIHKVDREAFELEIFAAFGPHTPTNVPALTDPNPHWPNTGHPWSYMAAPRLNAAISDKLDELADATEEQLSELDSRTALQLQAIKETAQQAVAKAQEGSTTERQRLDALWWLESLYSTSLHCSYRELDKELAVVTMAYDLLSLVPGIMPASVPYLLAEGINKLPGASFNDKFSIQSLLDNLKRQRTRLPVTWLKGVKPTLPDVRLSLRDLVVSTLTDSSKDIETLLHQAAIAPATELSLPEFGRALLRQEHAVRLAATKK